MAKDFDESKPLADDVRVINKISQNLHAEILLRLLGRERGNAGTVESGLEVMRQFLTQAGVASDQYSFFDGSGLSRQNLVTPQAVVRLLRYASSQSWGAAYKSSFPVADGWMALCALFAGIGFWLDRPWGPRFGLMAASAILYLAAMDITFDIENGMYALSVTNDAMKFEAFINASTLLLGLWTIAASWNPRRP